MGILKMLGFAVVFLLHGAAAQDVASLTRDELASVKKKLIAVFDALGQPPTGYVKEKEYFYLPTEAYRDDRSGRYHLIDASGSRTYSGGSAKMEEEARKEMEKEYEKKIAEAQVTGDYEALAKLAEEMQKKAGETQLEIIQARKEPIELSLRFNSNALETIDPDAVLFENPGVIALKSEEGSGMGKTLVAVYFDPVSLKDTRQLSKVKLEEPEGGVEKKTAVLYTTVELRGPSAEVEEWAKRIDVNKVLAQVDRLK